MAITKISSYSALSFKITNGVDTKGNTVYKTKSFSNVKPTASIENIYDVATTLSGILNNSADDFTLKETSAVKDI